MSRKVDEAKKMKLSRIAPFLICPQCGGTLNGTKSKCMKCNATYSHSENYYNFLTDEFRLQFEIKETENISDHEYDPIALSMIKDNMEGLILNCGSGCRKTDYPNVINLEIVDYSSTDVLGVGEKLPFQDETFDAVFSHNVLEHVKDPFQCAQEISRVLKRGCKLYCVVPFLQPFHGYPNHFYNMTSQGLRSLFENDLQIIDYGVPLPGLPIWALSWMLNSWVNGLEAKIREEFMNMRVRDLIGDPIDYLQEDFVKNLSREKNLELACTTMIIARK